MKIFRIFITCFLILLAGTMNLQAQEAPIAIIPYPASVNMMEGEFFVTTGTVITTSTSSDSLDQLAQYLNDQLTSALWADLDIKRQPAASDTVIRLTLDPQGSFENEEAYRLSVRPSEVEITAPHTAGLFYGIQSLLQLLPPEAFLSDPSLVPQNIQWRIPAVEISDYPQYGYRGLHLDVSRHFFPVSFLKKYIDLLAMHKMNRFHWHLTEDQGWRIEIKQYPKLTEVGAWRDSTLIGHYGTGRYDNRTHGGYYTQEEVRDVVKYAQKRHITIIPEIEMPGHSSAALAAYPELGCEPDKDYHVVSTWGVFEDIYCPSEETFTFLENVLTEVMDLFPSEYIHIGGDEAPKKAWENSDLAQQVIEREGLEDEAELQSYFIARIETFLNEHGRQIIGWDEILEGGLAPNATVMSWRGEEGGIEAAKMGHDVIMTPNGSLYLDHYQAQPTEEEPLAIGGFTTLEDVYAYEPTPEELSDEEAQHILGAQGNVWTEYMHSPEKVEYMVYPRAVALAEVLWSPEEVQDWDHFLQRLQLHFQRLDMLEVNAAEQYRE